MNINKELRIKGLFRVYCWGLTVGYGEFLRIYSIYKENICSICSEIDKKGKKFNMVTSCNHYFHRKCLDKLKSMSKCPNCSKQNKLTFVSERDETYDTPIKNTIWETKEYLNNRNSTSRFNTSSTPEGRICGISSSGLLKRESNSFRTVASSFSYYEQLDIPYHSSSFESSQILVRVNRVDSHEEPFHHDKSSSKSIKKYDIFGNIITPKKSKKAKI